MSLLQLVQAEEGAPLVLERTHVVRLKGEDRVTGGHELGPTLRAQEELTLLVVSVVGSRFHREELVQRGERFVLPPRGEERLRAGVERAAVPRIECENAPALLGHVV